MKKLGIIAGSGKMPLLVVEACQKQGRPFFLLGLKGHAKEEDFSSEIPQAWIRLGAVGKGFSLLKENQVEEVVMIGDSYLADIEGAHNAGWKACYFNRKNQVNHLKVIEFKEMKELLDKEKLWKLENY